jgi:hypothetical protein
MNVVGDPHSVKRINEFIANGFEVEIYGFQRTVFSPDPSIDVKIIGKLDDGKNYIKAQCGFLIFYVEKEKQDYVKKALSKLLYVPFIFENIGSRVLYYSAE